MDIKTGLIVWAAQAITLGMLLLGWWLRQRAQFHILSWGCGFLLFGTGLLLAGLRGTVPSFISIEVANLLVLIAIGLLVGGLQQFDNKPIQGFIFIPALLWIAGMLVPFVRETFNARVLLYNLAASIGFAILAVLLVRGADRKLWSRRLLAAILGVHIATSLSMAIMTATSAAREFASVPYPSLMLLPGAFCFIVAVLTGAQMMTERSEQKLRRLAVTDPLTGCLNRRGLIDAFQKLCASPSPGTPLVAFLHFDIDNFKQINDRYGHQSGDAVLVDFSRLASASLGHRGIFGRMGGEEFASLVRVADTVEAASIAEGLRMTLALNPISAHGHKIAVTVSVGIAVRPIVNTDLDTLLSEADGALYLAKQSGRNCSAIGRNGTATVVPSARMLSLDEMDMEIKASRQVSALRRVAAAGTD